MPEHREKPERTPESIQKVLERYGFHLVDGKEFYRHADKREIHWNAHNWTVVDFKHRVLECGQGLQELGVFLALTQQESQGKVPPL